MSFFELIENHRPSAADPGTAVCPGNSFVNTRQHLQQKQSPPGNQPTSATKAGRSCSHGKSARTRQPRAEKLKFLKACPICLGTSFTHGRNGGFFCNQCQPGITGQPVVAMGGNKKSETAKGLPCGGCGSTTYTKITNGYVFDNGTLADGWHCGGMSCHVKLFIGNKSVDPRVVSMAAPPGTEPLPGSPVLSRELKKSFQAGYPWIIENLDELKKAGWSAPSLFRRGKFTYPAGNWGLAWAPVWTKPDLQVRISGKTGAVSFHFAGTNGRTITQTAHRQGSR